jgi:hypothetical protein
VETTPGVVLFLREGRKKGVKGKGEKREKEKETER